MATLREWCRRLWGTLRGNPSDHDLERELTLHLELAEEDLRRRGHSRTDAARLARVRFGGSAHAMESLREQRGVPWLASSWLDVKLGLRILRKSWGLTLVGGLAMTLAIGIGAGVFAIFHTVWGGTLPLADGDRVVALQTWDAAARQARGTSFGDFERWRDDMRSVVDVGAVRGTVRRREFPSLVRPDALRLIVWDADDERLVSARIPLWLWRIVDDGSMGDLVDDLDLAVDDIDHHGPGLVLDHQEAHRRVLLWAE